MYFIVNDPKALALQADERQLRFIFRTPKLRPPILEEIQPDCERIAKSLAKRYCDLSCYALHEDEIYGVVMERLARLIAKGFLVKHRSGKIMTRFDFFKVFTTAAKNCVRSLVQKHRFTEKRTGFKPPKRDANGFNDNTRKPLEVSLDNPDTHVQISDCGGQEAEIQTVKDIKLLLNESEKMVFSQLSDPNHASVIFATIDSFRNHGKTRKVVIQDSNLADGLGIALSEFLRIRENIKRKVTAYMSDTEDPKINLATKTLCDFFGIQIPKDIEPLVIRRMFTLLARDNADRLTDEVKTNLTTVGALIPEKLANSLNCFGVLYDEKDSSCRRCGVNESCRVKAANYGLGTITISRTLIRQTRFPVIAAHHADEMESDEPEPVLLSEKDEEIYNYLTAHFNRTKTSDGWAFRHGEASNHAPLVTIDQRGRFKICKPSRHISHELEKYKTAFYIPSECEASDAIALIEKHAQQTLLDQSQPTPSIT